MALIKTKLFNTVCVSGDDDLDLLTELLAENGAEEEPQASQEAEDNLDDLFDNDDDDEEYREGLEGEEEDGAVALFGDVDGIEEEEGVKTQPSGGKAPDNLNKSQEDLQGLSVPQNDYDSAIP